MAEDRRTTGIGESTITVKWWGVLLILMGLFGWVVIGIVSLDRRVTTIETKFDIQLPQITVSLERLNTMTTEIRDTQIRTQKELERK